MEELSLRAITPGRCWWCGDPADSREHKLKRSDLVREFGNPPYQGERTLIRISAQSRHEAQGPNSTLFKFQPSMCARCNNERSQAFDVAWDRLTTYLVDNESAILATRQVDLGAVFGDSWRDDAANAARYLVKHLVCRIVNELPGPISLDEPLFTFLDGGPYPDSLQLDICLDLGVVEMLRLTRSAPSMDPKAAEAGFLNLTQIWVNVDEEQCWHTPQAGMHYRWLAVYWRIGDGGPANPFDERVVQLKPSDELFGEEFREFLAATAGVPREVLANVPEGVPAHEVVRAAGYLEAADHMKRLVEKVEAQRAS